MNIFILDTDPKKAAQMLCDKHIPKMIVESAQMLSTAHRMLDGTQAQRKSKSGKRIINTYVFNDVRDDLFYAAVHHNHPCTKWTMESLDNYNWHYHHFANMAAEYHYRRERQHATWQKMSMILAAHPENIPKVGLTEFAQAMNHYPECKVEGNAVQAYRNYYHTAKPFAKWEWKRPAPDWWEGYKGADIQVA